MFLCVISEDVSYEDLRGITRPGMPLAGVNELGEGLLSLFAICRARAALAAATAFCPDNVVASTLVEKAEPSA
ncbi:hypothetical protein ABIB68_001768 [Bradyrhizobium sp. F1.2.2]